MITLRHFHDRDLRYETTIPLPAVKLQLKTAVKMILQRSREQGFRAAVKDIDVRLFPGDWNPGPEVVVKNGDTVSIRTSSKAATPLELWDLDV